MLRQRAMCALSPVSPVLRRAVLSACLLLACLWLDIDCSTNNFTPVAREAGAPADDGSATDSSSSDAPSACKAGPPTCVKTAMGSFVSTCRADGGAVELTPCGDDEHCSLGRCTSTECASAELADAARGCLFYGFRANNIDTDIDRPTMLVLSNGSQVQADVEVQVRGADGTWAIIARVQVPQLGGQRLSLDQPEALANAGFLPRAAFRVVSSNPVMVVQISSDDLDRGARSSGATVLRPVQALGSRHLAMTYQQLSSANVAATAGSHAGAGAMVIVATHDDTTVTITPSADAFVNPDGIMISPARVPQAVDLSEGDALQIFSAADQGDLTGTLVESNHPVAAFSGNVYSTYGAEVTGFNGGDLAIEQLPPVEAWGNEYVGAWLSPQSNCDPFFGPEAGLWTVMAADDNTQINILPATGVTLETRSPFILDRGKGITFVVRGVAATDSSPRNPGDFYVTGSGPILLGQWLECEPALSWGIDLRHGPSMLSVTLPPSFDHEIVVVREHGLKVMLDGTQDLESRFLSTVGPSRYEIGRISQEDLGPCTDLHDPCTHVIGAGAFGVAWRGMDVVCSYAVTVPPRGTGCVLPGLSCVN